MFKTRALTAAALLTGFLSALFFAPAPVWVALVAAVAGLAAFEWGRLVGLARKGNALFSVGVAGATLVLAGPFMAKTGLTDSVLYTSLAFWLGLVPWWLARRWRLGQGAGVVVGVVVVVPAALSMMMLRDISPWVLLFFMVLVWVADSAAYFTGRAFGRRKLAPSISPGKTWEGALGAVVAVALVGLLLNQWLARVGPMALDASWVFPELMLIVALSIIGDLFESLLKRHAGVKDSGHTLPGHGGVLDRIDSLTSTLPFALLLLLAHA